MAFGTSAVRAGWRCSSRQDDPRESTRRSHSRLTTWHNWCVNCAPVVFDDYHTPELRTSDGIASVNGNYPSTGASGARRVVSRQ